MTQPAVNRAEILEKAIRKAMTGGFFKQLEKTLWVIHPGNDVGRLLVCVPDFKDEVSHHIAATEVIYDHDFAKCLWGEGWAWFTEGTSGDTLPSGNYINWRGHIANMAVADDPIIYLEKNI